jgi:hypothetical protein
MRAKSSDTLRVVSRVFWVICSSFLIERGCLVNIFPDGFVSEGDSDLHDLTSPASLDFSVKELHPPMLVRVLQLQN